MIGKFIREKIALRKKEILEREERSKLTVKERINQVRKTL